MRISLYTTAVAFFAIAGLSHAVKLQEDPYDMQYTEVDALASPPVAKPTTATAPATIKKPEPVTVTTDEPENMAT